MYATDYSKLFPIYRCRFHEVCTYSTGMRAHLFSPHEYAHAQCVLCEVVLPVMHLGSTAHFEDHIVGCPDATFVSLRTLTWELGVLFTLQHRTEEGFRGTVDVADRLQQGLRRLRKAGAYCFQQCFGGFKGPDTSLG